LGIREVNAPENRIVWEPHSGRNNGIRNLKMGGKSFSLIAFPAENKVEVDASADFTLCLNGRDISCPAGKSILPLL